VSRFQEHLNRFFYDPDEEVGPFLELAPEVDASPASLPQETPEDFLAFSLEGELYAVPITQVREILKVPDLTEVPRAAANIVGLMNIRGDMLPLYDLKRRLQLLESVPVVRSAADVKPTARVVLVHDAQGDAGIFVDRVEGVVKLVLSRLEVAPNLGVEQNCIAGLGRRGDALFILIDLGLALA
jgi:purine-binding chemotaxis protein CheW